jgi:hypothetical protein
MYKQPTAPQPIGVVLDNAIQLYRASFRSCWVLSLIGSIALAASGLYMAAQMRGVGIAGAGVQSAQAVRAAMQALAAYGSGGAIKADIIIFLVSLIIYSALLAQMNSVALGRATQSPVDSLGAALRRLPGAIVASIVWTFAIGLGLVLFLIPGIYLWGKLQYWIVAVFADDVGAIESLGRSWNATYGNWWRSTTILSVALIIILVLDLLATLVTGLFAGFQFTARATDLGGMLFTAQIVRAVAQVFLLPMIPAALLAIYYDLRLRREGGDLLTRVNSIPSS